MLRAEPDGSVTRLRDVARIELGAQDYTLNAYLDNKNATALGIFQRPGSNALATSDRRQGDDGAAEEGLPGGPRLLGGLQSDGVHPGLGRRGDRDAVRGAAAGRDRGDRVPADLAGGDHPAARHPGVADRLVRRDGGGRHLVQHAVAVRPGAGDRHRRRRRHRRGRERRALPDPGHVAQGRGAQDHGRGGRRADRHLAGADRGVPADRLHHRPAGHVLQAVRHHHRGLDGDLGLRVADAVARHGGAAAQDPRAVAYREAQADAARAAGLAAQLVLPPFQPRLRGAVELLRPRHGAADPHGDDRPGRLWRPAGPRRQPAGRDADRPDPAARPVLSDRRHAASAGRDPGARRQAGAPGVGDDHGDARRVARRGLRRLRRRHLHQRAQHRRDLRHPEAVRGAARRAQGQDPGGAARQDVLAARSLRVRARAALGARHRHRRRPEGLRPGSRRARPAGARGRHLGAGRRRRADARPDPGLHAVQHQHAADLGRDRPHQGRAAGRADRRACSTRCRSTWARPTSTTSTSSAAPIR